MTNILDQVAKSAAFTRYSHFEPTDQEQYFALRLADKLNDAVAARHYVELSEHYSQAQLLTAFRRVKTVGCHLDPARCFHEELKRLEGRKGDILPARFLAAIRIERRAIALALMQGDHLAAAPLVRQLSSDTDKALGSAALFISRILEKYPVRTAALETIPHEEEVLRGDLADILMRVLIEREVAIWHVPKAEVLLSFAYPRPRFRNQVRKVISSIWPGVDGSFGAPLMRDALALGLYCQIEYLFNL